MNIFKRIYYSIREIILPFDSDEICGWSLRHNKLCEHNCLHFEEESELNG